MHRRRTRLGRHHARAPGPVHSRRPAGGGAMTTGEAAATATSTAGARALLEVQDLCVSYRHGGRSFSALEKVSVDVQAGQTVAVVGESGAGKSTLGRAVLG